MYNWQISVLVGDVKACRSGAFIAHVPEISATDPRVVFSVGPCQRQIFPPFSAPLRLCTQDTRGFNLLAVVCIRTRLVFTDCQRSGFFSSSLSPNIPPEQSNVNT
ncbi:hypothetical protein F2P81_015657 [Scophthalmus maximus]|uniref:Uncharacterized protein n=1 Tax=Scophthalmus maximus TaxID=52904 RepID=A0A6A4SLA1_SCOMX|nr:hypothetical protein F2P81_015657 [Scophthalmus maximus]